MGGVPRTCGGEMAKIIRTASAFRDTCRFDRRAAPTLKHHEKTSEGTP
jgi:hypothetical protein